MSVTIISYVRNESDIIEAFVRHHALVADQIIIVDNGSTDETPILLERLQMEGFPVEIRIDHSDYHRQTRTLTELMQDVSAKEDPDWIIPLDADEFLIGNEVGSVSDTLARLEQDAACLVPWRTYVPEPDDDVSERNVLRRIRHRRSREETPFCKVMIPRALHHDSSLRLSPGNHLLEHENNGSVPAQQTDLLAIAHFPVRSVDQLRQKIMTGWQRTRRDPELRTDQNFHWHMLYDQLLDQPALTKKHLREIAVRYALQLDEPTPGIVLDPVQCHFDCTHTRFI